MPRIRVKICGLRTSADALAAARAGADAVGLVFVPASPRDVSFEAARAVVEALPAFVEPVGLFVNAAAEEIFTAAREVGLRTIQLHGSEPPEMLQQLREFRVLKALPFKDGRLEGAEAWLARPPANLAALLVDAPPAKDAAPGQTGGSGHAVDWTALRRELDRLAPGVPVVLAGGLTPENVAEAVRVVRPYAVDVSSGVESVRGVKNADKIAAFCAAALGA